MTLSVVEFKASRNARSALDPLVMLPPLAEQSLAVGATSVQSAAFNAATDTIRLQAKENCCISVAANPTATVTNMQLAAGAAEYFGVAPGSNLKIAVIAAS